MIRLAPLLALCVAATATAQTELPYYQDQRLVVIFAVPTPLEGVRPDGSRFPVLAAGTYRFDARARTQSIQTEANFRDGSGPFARFGRALEGQIRPLAGVGPTREATVDLRLGDADFSRENVVRAAALGFRFRIRLDAMTSTSVRYAGDVAAAGAFVRGALHNVVTLPPQPGQIDVWHVKLAFEDHLPQRRPLEDFPARIEARVRPIAQGPIEAGPFDFELTRDALNEVGAAYYEADAAFPMVEERDHYGDYRSRVYRAQLGIREDGKIWLRLIWGLNGRYHSWRLSYRVTLEPAEYARLRQGQPLSVSGTARYTYDDELRRVEEESPATFELRASAVAGISAALPN